MEEFKTRVRYIWSEADVNAPMFAAVAARHAQVKLRAMNPTAGVQPRVRYLPTVAQFEVEFTVFSLGSVPQQLIVEACSRAVLRAVEPWVKAEHVWRVETETRPVTPGTVLGDAR